MLARTAQEIADLIGAELRGDGSLTIDRLDTLEAADAGTLTFIGEPKFASHWHDSKAAAAIVTQAIVDEAQLEPGDGRALLLVDNADLAMARVLDDRAVPDPVPQVEPGTVHASAIVHPDAKLGENVTIGAGATVGAHATLGDGCVLHANAHVYDHATLGPGCVLWPGSLVRERCVLGARVILHTNAVVGTDGFGYRPDADELPDGSRRPTIRKVPHLGNVVIGDECELGACCCVDKGKFGPTTLGRACKLDNHVQIGHNCTLGDCVVISGCTAIAGSCTVGHGVLIGGQGAIADHLTIGDGAQLAGGIQLMHNVPPGARYAGSPGRPMTTVARELTALSRLPEAMRQLKKMMKG
ncbi:MAG: UDP-3-O-(3-hydroxymyristoyl)glucosamine N-acyltransferase [Planctomycetota bacterium]